MNRKELKSLLTFSAVGGALGLGIWSMTSGGKSSSKGEPEPEPPSNPIKPPLAWTPHHVIPSDQPAQYPGGDLPPSGADCMKNSPVTGSTKMFGGFPVEPLTRNQFILENVREGNYDDIEWIPITSSARGHTATFYVMADTLKMGGVRVCANAKTTQLIADSLGASLLTPTLCDLIFSQATVRLPQLNQPITNSTEFMIKYSGIIDQAIASVAGGYPLGPAELVANQGKNWVISPRLLEKPLNPNCEFKDLQGRIISQMPIPRPSDRSCNYGWHIPDTSNPPKDNADIPNFTVDGRRYKVTQSAGICHDLCHDDYSQLVNLVKSECVVDGKPSNLQSVLVNPELAWLASARTGAYPVAALRLPGVRRGITA